MGDVPRRTWGAKYSLRKALTRLTGPRKVRKMATIQAFCAWRDPGSNPEEAASGAKTWSRAAPALRLSLRTGIWLTAWMGCGEQPAPHNPVNRPPKSAKNGHNSGFLRKARPRQRPPRTLRLGRKRGAGRLRLSVCLFRTGIWLTAWMGRAGACGTHARRAAGDLRPPAGRVPRSPVHLHVLVGVAHPLSSLHRRGRPLVHLRDLGQTPLHFGPRGLPAAVRTDPSGTDARDGSWFPFDPFSVIMRMWDFRIHADRRRNHHERPELAGKNRPPRRLLHHGQLHLLCSRQWTMETTDYGQE